MGILKGLAGAAVAVVIVGVACTALHSGQDRSSMLLAAPVSTNTVNRPVAAIRGGTQGSWQQWRANPSSEHRSVPMAAGSQAIPQEQGHAAHIPKPVSKVTNPCVCLPTFHNRA